MSRKHGAKAPVESAERPSSSNLRERAAALNRAHEQLHEAFRQRDRSKTGWASWEQAASEFHAALRRMYPPEFWAAVDRLKRRDVSEVDEAIRFLELDPWCDRSGYVKADLARYLARVPLTAAQARRLRGVVMLMVDLPRHRREFRAYCRLAKAIDTPELRELLLERRTKAERHVARHEAWMLEALGDPEALRLSRASPGRLSQLPDLESAVRRVVHEARGQERRVLDTLDEARQLPDAVVVLEGSYGGQIYVVCPAAVVQCGEDELQALLTELDRLERNDPDGARVFYTQLPMGASVVGGVGSGIVYDSIWVHARLHARGHRPFVERALLTRLVTD